MFSQLIKFIRLLGSETEPSQISMAFALAMILGFTPLLSAHNILVIFFLLIFRVNIAAFILASFVFSGFAYMLDPVFDQFGQYILSLPELIPTWTELYNSSWWRITRFNNTLVMGSLMASLIAFIPVALLSNILIKRYRTHVIAYVKNSHLFNILQNNKWISRLIKVAE